MYKLINVRNIDNVELDGYFFDANSQTCILHIPGFGGAFDRLPEVMGEYFQSRGISYLCGLTQGAYHNHEYKKYNSDGSVSVKLGGSMYEDFDESKDDIEAFVLYLKNLGYKEIYILGHSLGCNKVLYYSKEYNSNLIKGIILLAPQDFSQMVSIPIHKEMLIEAELNMKSGEPYKILTQKFLGFAPMSSQTFYKFATGKNQHNFNYTNTDDNFETLLAIDKPILFIMGDKDPAFEKNKEEKMMILLENVKNKYDKFSYIIIPNGRHSFNDLENVVAQYVFDFIGNTKC